MHPSSPKRRPALAEAVTRQAKSAVRRLVRQFGFDLVRLNPTSRTRIFREKKITLLLDVGANTGQYAQMVRANGYAGRIVSFEPLTDAFRELTRAASSDEAWQCKQIALGDMDGTAQLNVWSDSRISSLLRLSKPELEANQEWWPIGVEDVPVRRLDSLKSELLQASDAVYLKMDVQGSELPILHGAKSTLAQVRAIEAELTFAPMYEGQALIHEVLSYLYDAGFYLVWIERVYETPCSGYLLQADGIFVRSEDGAPRPTRPS